MKRRSDVVYVASDRLAPNTEFCLKPDFSFHLSTLPKLVDYSFHDDSDDEYDSRTQCPGSLEQLNTLVHDIEGTVNGTVKGNRRSERLNRVRRSGSAALRDCASLRLEVEEKEELRRKERLMKQLNEVLSTSRRVCDSERPGKKRKVEMSSVLNRLLFRKSCRLLRGKKSAQSKKKQTTSVCLDDTITPQCFLGFRKFRK